VETGIPGVPVFFAPKFLEVAEFFGDAFDDMTLVTGFLTTTLNNRPAFNLLHKIIIF